MSCGLTKTQRIYMFDISAESITVIVSKSSKDIKGRTDAPEQRDSCSKPFVINVCTACKRGIITKGQDMVAQFRDEKCLLGHFDSLAEWPVETVS